MNAASYSIKNKTVMLVMILIIVVGGAISYLKLGRLEDPDFTIKQAVIYTQYPGATAEEVEEEVTEPLESAIQQLKQLDEVTSISRSGLSIIYAEMQEIYDAETLPQVWDELRRKINSAAEDLPPGVSKPEVNDDFGDVYGVLFSITGDGYSNHDLKEFAKDLRKELLLCDQVGRIDLWGDQQEIVYVEIDRFKLAQLGLTSSSIFNTISEQNAVTSAGKVQVGPEQINLRLSGAFTSVKDIEDLLVKGASSDRIIRIKDVATVKRSYYDPPTELLLRNGNPGVGLGISTIAGGNVVAMGEAVRSKLHELRSHIPVGIDIQNISFQGDTVSESVRGFVVNLTEAVVIVILVLVIFMGLREGLIMGIVLLLTILATFMIMKVLDVSLQRISLGALIIALGMLVDNAIVVTEGIVIKSLQGKTKIKAAEETVSEVQWPLLGATLIAILAFAAIAVSKDVTGEYLHSLFQVISTSLLLSWVFAITITPYLCVTLLPTPKEANLEVHNTPFFRLYKKFLKLCVNLRWVTLVCVGGMLFAALYGFQFVQHNFFPDSSRPQFMLHIWYPEGTHISETQQNVSQLGADIDKIPGVTNITAFIGNGAPRFILTYSPEMPDSSYAMLLVDVKDYDSLKPTMAKASTYLAANHSDSIYHVEPFKLGPNAGAVEARLSGRDPDVLRRLGEEIMNIMHAEPNAGTIMQDWRERVKTLDVKLAETRMREVGVGRPDVGEALQMNFSGLAAATYRDGDEVLPIMLRPPDAQRHGINHLNDLQVFNSTTGKAIPIGQVTDGWQTSFEEPVIQRRDRMRTLTVSCEQLSGTAADLFKKLQPQIEAIQLPEGYSLEWGGEHEKSEDANTKLMANVPIAFVAMFLITVFLFNTLRHPLIIFLGLPLAVIGVSAGLLLTNQPFGFMALLGFLSLAGMLIKNEIVLLDQVNIERAQGKPAYPALIDASVSRVRPVCMAALTTVLGMVPLVWDPFFAPMAVTIMGGLTFATLLTLVVTPVLYALFFRVHRDKKTKARDNDKAQMQTKEKMNVLPN